MVVSAVRNSGNLMQGLTATSQLDGTITCAPAVIAPGSTATCTHEGYPVTQQNIDDGSLSFSVSYVGKGVIDSFESSRPAQTVNAEDRSAFSVKVDVLSGNGFTAEGEMSCICGRAFTEGSCDKC